jgi:O-Antigen ligase
MVSLLRRARIEQHWWRYAAIAAILLGAAILGRSPSLLWIGLIAGIGVMVVLLKKPLLGLFLLIIVALLGPISIGTGTEVSLNLSALLIPVLFVIWLLIRMNRHDIRLVASPTTKPLVAFLILVILSIFISNVIWDPNVPRRDNFILVQFGQWGIWAFSAAAFWLVGNFIKQEVWLRRLTATFLLLAGALAIVRVLPGGSPVIDIVATHAITRAPFWMVLTALAAGQLMFNQTLSTRWRVFLIAILVAVFAYSFFGEQQERTSNWASVGTVLGVLLWLRLPKLRWLVVAIAIILAASGVLFQTLYTFAGGDAKWSESGASRGVLIGRVLEDSMRNPITGIGPAAYRWYGMTRPLGYEGAWWIQPLVNSHNNYVDLFSQTGVVGVALFLWFMLELLRVGSMLRAQYTADFAGGYVAAMLGAWFAVMVLMALADWFLPFVYNEGFPGFQASVLVWMFFGGLLFYEGLGPQPAGELQS